MPKAPQPEIHQIYFRKEQLANLDSTFIPYFKPENQEAEWREYWTFKKNSARAIRSRGLTGYVSWKFTAKSGVPASKFRDFIRRNPGYDLYFINPFLIQPLLFKNVWQHGEFYHPGLIRFSQQILQKAGYHVDIRNLSHTPEMAGYSNYWVGNAKFWRKYMDFTRPLENYIRHHLTDEESAFVYSIADPVSNCSHIPFMLERLFTTLLVTDPDIRYLAYCYDSADVAKRLPRGHRILYKILNHNLVRSTFLGRFFAVLIRFVSKVQKKIRG